jgi:hypothetical protein
MSPLACRRVLILLLAAHVVWGAARLPGKVWGRRLDDIARYRDPAIGAAGWFLDTQYYQGAAAIRFALANVRSDEAVLFDGPGMGALEFAPALLAPRLVVAAAACAAGATEYAGHRLGRATLPDGRTGVLVLLGRGNDIGLDVR